MKSILLASVATIAFAGVAAAEVTFSGTAELGYNDFENTVAGTDDNAFGFYADADLGVTFTQELDNGLTAGLTWGVDISSELGGNLDLDAKDPTLSLTSETAGLYFGDTGFAADKHWASAGDMESDGFSANDGEVVLRGDVMMGGVSASVSYATTDAAGISVRSTNGSDVDQLSIGAAATFGAINVAVAYQEASEAVFGAQAAAANGDYNPNEIFGISAGGSFGGADVTLAYAKDNTTGEDSLGAKVSYPVGPVTLTAYYVSESEAAGDNFGVNAKYAQGPITVALDYQDDQGVAKTALDASYDVGNGLTVYAGMYMEDLESDEFYVAAGYDLGGGAAVLVSYADAGTTGNADDEIGANDYQEGTTVEVSFSF